MPVTDVYRNLGVKWTAYENQLAHIAAWAQCHPVDERGHRLLGLAATSDILAAEFTRFQNAKRPIRFDAYAPVEHIPEGMHAPITLGYSQDVIDICTAAHQAYTLRKPLRDLLDKNEVRRSLLQKSVLEWSERYQL